ncbi:MAG TPA: inositol monophosphatase family protein [Chthoniobacterales bacterium]|jgi:myo-inositol-1(or 4)-monophosphatase|nr:inositol monophosphatase family protein [Chthoniobacterales bacterium]
MSEYLHAAIEAAQAAGGLLRANFGVALTVDENLAHDIKLELDKRSQTLIESLLLARYPDHAIYGEEGMRGDQASEYQWIIDPIDGTVNFFYGIGHFAVSIALRQAGKIIVGVIYDPLRDELWACEAGHPPTLNGLPMRVSERSRLGECMVSVGVSKTLDSVQASLPLFTRMVTSAKKCRMMGSASLDIAYVACGRLDAYIEGQISLWDIAAGLLLVESAGGKVDLKPHATHPDKYAIVATSGNVDLGL